MQLVRLSGNDSIMLLLGCSCASNPSIVCGSEIRDESFQGKPGLDMTRYERCELRGALRVQPSFDAG